MFKINYEINQAMEIHSHHANSHSMLTTSQIKQRMFSVIANKWWTLVCETRYMQM